MEDDKLEFVKEFSRLSYPGQTRTRVTSDLTRAYQAGLNS